MTEEMEELEVSSAIQDTMAGSAIVYTIAGKYKEEIQKLKDENKQAKEIIIHLVDEFAFSWFI